MTEARRLLERTLEHCEELRKAWERGALDEHDGKGGTRSNRNYALVIELERFLAQPMTSCEGAVAVQDLLSEVIERLDGTHYQDEGLMLVHVSARLNECPGSSREGELVAALERERDRWRAALTAFKGNDTVDIDYASALRAESELTRTLEEK
ncbi:hypothetical protein LCGC14_1600400 [marine sediment metagenome]|uniref:Uncharacterized protein n=1 Tax=marine sediment metagenome TaxID=412755 RepID=A0A0F9KRZ7_9ZZZZ